MSRQEIRFTQKLQRYFVVNIFTLSLVTINSSADFNESLIGHEASPQTPMVILECCDSSESINHVSEAEKALDTPLISPDRRLNQSSDDGGCMPPGRSGLKLENTK